MPRPAWPGHRRARGQYRAGVLDAVLFDLDGTLTNPEEGITGSFRKAMAAVGHPLADDEDLRWMIGPTLAESLDRAGVPGEHHQTVIDAYRSHLRAEGLFQANLIDGVAAVLDGLRADGVRLALASAKMIEMGETTLRHFGLLDRFELVAGCLPDGAVRTEMSSLDQPLEAFLAAVPAK